jgi:predicted RNA-binding protein with RPS1 domain
LLPLEGTIYNGKIVKIESFGAFVSLQGYRQQGLVHISQLVRDRVESANEVVTIDQEVYVKVLGIDTTDSNRPKISLSMKYADQGSGADKDPNGVEAELSMRKKTTRKGEPEPLKLEAVLNTVCKRCGGRGHISSECFNTGGVKYELVEAESDEKVSLQPEVTTSALASTTSAPVGRGRGAVLPSWLTNTNSTSDAHLGGIIGGNTSGTVQKKERDKKTKKEKKSKKSKKGVEKKKSKDKKHKKDKQRKEKHKGHSKKVLKTHETAVAPIRSASLSSSSSSSSSTSSRSRSNSTRS